MKDKAYQTLFPNLTQLKRMIISAARIVSADLLQNVWNSSETRIQSFIRENGGHFEDLLHALKSLRDSQYHEKSRC